VFRSSYATYDALALRAELGAEVRAPKNTPSSAMPDRGGTHLLKYSIAELL
jgi:hypothetical protein